MQKSVRKSSKHISRTASLRRHSFFRIFSNIPDTVENFRTYILTQPFFLTVTRREKPSFLRRYLFTVIVVLVISILRNFLNLSLEENISFIIFTFAVVISAWYGGLGSGLFATLLCVLSGIFFSVEPGSALRLTSGSDQLRILIFVLQGLIISLLTETVQDATRWQSIILESISDVFITYDRNMRFVYVNHMAEEMFQTTRKQLLGRKLADFYPDAKKTVVYRNCVESMRMQKSMTFELYVEEDDIWFDVSLYPSSDGVSCYYQNITKRKRIEKKLRESQLQFKRFVDANIIGVLVADLEGKIYEANDIFLSIIGYSRQDLKAGKISWKKLTPPEYQELTEQSNREVLRRGVAEPFMKEYIRRDNSRVAVLVGKILLSKRERRVIAFCMDITEQKELERKKNEFISIASHELKTPLTTIKAFTQILLKQKKNDKRSSYFLKNIDTQLDKLNVLISDLLDVSKMEVGKLDFHKKQFVLDELVTKVIIDSQYITPSHSIVKDGMSKKIVEADEHRIEQVLINLISNAVKYSPDAERVIVRINDTPRNVMVSVQDFGIGIPEAEQKKIFDRFFRSDMQKNADVSGFGLGLYITKEIIDRHGGKLTVVSQVGVGSTFSFTLPVVNNKR